MRKHTATAGATPAAPPVRAKRPRPEAAATPSADAQRLGMAPGPALLDGPSRDALVRERAYARYESNGCVDGHDVDDWLAAEAEVGALLAEAGHHKAASAG